MAANDLLDLIEFTQILKQEHESVSASDVLKLCKLASRHQRACERECNDGGDHAEPIEKQIKELCEANGLAVNISGDPRGYTVKILLRSKRSNSFGGEGWGVPCI